MATIVTRAGKGSPLTNAEVDANFTNLNGDKIEPADVRTLTNKTIDSITNTIGADHIHFKVKASAAISKGQPVKFVGYNSGANAFEVAPTSSSLDVAIGLSHDTLASGHFGAIINTGVLEGFDTSSFAEGSVVYPNASGGLSATQPSSGTYQAIAYVLRSHANNGAVLVEATEPAAVRTSSNVGNTVVLRDGSGNFSAGAITASLLGNASTASALATSRLISLSGDASGSASFDGSSNAIISLTLANSGVTAGTYGDATNIPQLAVDAKGRITSVSNVAVSIPSGSLAFTGDVTGSGSTGSSTALTLAASGVTAGSYTNVSLTVDSKGRITSASNGSGGGVSSFNTRTGAVTLSSGDVTGALGFTPYNSTNPSGYITSSGNAATATNCNSANAKWTSAPVAGSTTSGGVVSAEFRNNGGTGDANVAAIGFHCTGTYAIHMHLRADGYFGLGGWSRGAWSWYSAPNGDMVAAGNVSAYSDERLKKDWAALPADFVERLAGIKGGTYTRIDTGDRQAGSSAQDWRELLPEVVTVGADDDKTLTLTYGNAALVSAIELAKRVVALEAKLAAMQS